MTRPTIGSLCTGYGGLDMAAAAYFDADVLWVADNHPACVRLLEIHHPGIPNLGDLTTVDFTTTPPVDILTAGFPCQPFSVAGARKGAEDERYIWDWIGDAISVLRPGVVLLENVPGILTLGGPGVIAALTELGYDASFGLIRASATGVPHRRTRWFCVARDAQSPADSDIAGLERQGRLAEIGAPRRQFAPPGDSPPCEGATDSDGGRREDLRPGDQLEETEESHERLYAAFGPYESAVRSWERQFGPAPIPTDERGVTTKFIEWMMALPPGHVTGHGLSRTDEMILLGNGVVPIQAYLALSVLLGG